MLGMKVKKLSVATTEGDWVGSVTKLNPSQPNNTCSDDSTTCYPDSDDSNHCPDSEWMMSELSAEEVTQAADCCYIQASDKEKALTTCARHLTSDKGDRDVALSNLKATLAWRNSNGVSELRNLQRGDDLADKMEHELGTHGRLCVRGRDKEGRAIVHIVTRHAPRGGVQDKAAYIQSHCLAFERAVAATERYGEKTDLIVAADLSDFAMWQIPNLELTKELSHMAGAYYPNRLYKLYVIDAPRLFRLFWMLLRPFLDPETVAKYQFVSGRKQKDKILGTAIDADQAMPHMLSDGKLTEPWDIQRFLYDVDFDKAYDEK